MHSILRYILLSIICYGCGDGQAPLIEVSKSETELHADEGLVYHKNQPFTGRVISTYPTGKHAEAIEYTKGIRSGHHRKWFEDGELSFESTWTKGQMHGLSRSWWKNGNLRSESNHVEGKLHGTQLQWYISGARFKERTLNMGREEGMQRSWRENGKVYNNYEARNGRIFGMKRASLCFQLDNEEVQINE